MSGYTREYCVEMEAKFAKIAVDYTQAMLDTDSRMGFDAAKEMRERAESERGAWEARISHIDWVADRKKRDEKERADAENAPVRWLFWRR